MRGWSPRRFVGKTILYPGTAPLLNIITGLCLEEGLSPDTILFCRQIVSETNPSCLAYFSFSVSLQTFPGAIVPGDGGGFRALKRRASEVGQDLSDAGVGRIRECAAWPGTSRTRSGSDGAGLLG